MRDSNQGKTCFVVPAHYILTPPVAKLFLQAGFYDWLIQPVPTVAKAECGQYPTFVCCEGGINAYNKVRFSFWWSGKTLSYYFLSQLFIFRTILLVFVACSSLHLVCLPPSLKKEEKGKPIKTIGAVCRQRGQCLIENLIVFAHNLLEQGCSTTELFTSLFSKQHQEVLI